MQFWASKRFSLAVLWGSWILALFGLAKGVSAQVQQASCMLTTPGNTGEALNVTILLECSSMESQSALHYHVQSAGPSVRDRRLDILFTIANTPEGRYPVQHRKTVLLNEGAASTSGTIPFSLTISPDSSNQRIQFWNVSISEDGRNVEASRAIQTSPGAAYVPLRLNPGEPPHPMLLQRGASNSPILYVLEHPALLNNLPPYAAGLMSGSHIIDTPVFDLARDPTRASSIRNIASMPEYWQYYLQFRMVCLNTNCLAQLRDQRPQAAAAVKKFVASGGNLLFFATGNDDRKMVDRWLSGSEDVADKPDDRWESFKSANGRWSNRNSTRSNRPFEVPDSMAEGQSSAALADEQDMIRNYGRGHILLLHVEGGLTHQQLLGELPPSTGLAVSSVNDEGWPLRNLISSVGRPPVWTFCTIILLFGLILGPGLLVLTGWIGRRSLLILLVPLVSLGATLAIVSYQVLHEGFGTHARSTSVLHVDEQTEEAFVWSRQTYFAGWPPREGAEVPNEVYCRPVSNFWDRSRSNRYAPSLQYKVSHEPESSLWTGVLPAREQRQFLLGHALKYKTPIKAKEVAKGRMVLSNLTDEELPFVVLRDGSNNFYLAENVAPHAEVQLTGGPFDEIAGTISRMRSQFLPAPPADLRTLGWNTINLQNNAEVLDQTWNSALSEQSISSSIRPFGFVTIIRNGENIYMPFKTNTHESLVLVTGRLVW